MYRWHRETVEHHQESQGGLHGGRLEVCEVQLEQAEEDDEECATGRCSLRLDIRGRITGSWSKLKKMMKSVRRDGVASG